MNFIYSTLINKTENKMAGYMALLDFRYQNLCVMAEPGSLFSVLKKRTLRTWQTSPSPMISIWQSFPRAPSLSIR